MMHKIIPLLIVSVIASSRGAMKPIHPDKPISNSGEEVITLNPPILSDPELSIKSGYSKSSSKEEVKPEETDYFASKGVYGPFSLDNPPEHINLEFYYEFYSINNVKLRTHFMVYKEKELIYLHRSSPELYKKGQRNTLEYSKIPIKQYWSEKGLKIVLEFYDYRKVSDERLLKDFSVSFYPPKEKEIMGEYFLNFRHETDNSCFYADGKELKNYIEIYDFRTMGSYIDNDYYYRLDVSKNYFLYPNEIDFAYEKASLLFEDKNHFFKYLKHDEDGMVEIPLRIVKDEDKYRFKFNRTFYVNKRTLEMSDDAREGFIYSTYFFLPMNGLEKFNNKTLYFYIKNMGADKISTFLPLKYETNRTIVGLCDNSEYCVEGGNN